MPHIIILLKTGEKREFPERYRPGGSYTNSIRYEGAFVIVRDEYACETAFPAVDVSEVTVQRTRW